MSVPCVPPHPAVSKLLASAGDAAVVGASRSGFGFPAGCRFCNGEGLGRKEKDLCLWSARMITSHFPWPG